MSTRTPGLHDVIRVHHGVITPDGHDLSGQLLTVVGTHVVVCLELDATCSTGARPVHLLADQVDVITPKWSPRA